MSAYILPIEGFVRLATELARHAENPQNVCDVNYGIASRIRECLGFHSSCFDAPTDAHPEAALKCQLLQEANVAAVNERYEHLNNPSPVLNPCFVRLRIRKPWAPTQLYKHLCCLRYQMAEGEVIDSDIYKELDTLVTDLADIIVSNSAEYSQSEWGWDSEARAA